MKLLSWNFHVLNNGKPLNPIYSYCSRAKNKNHSMIQTYPQIMGKKHKNQLHHHPRLGCFHSNEGTSATNLAQISARIEVAA